MLIEGFFFFFFWTFHICTSPGFGKTFQFLTGIRKYQEFDPWLGFHFYFSLGKDGLNCFFVFQKILTFIGVNKRGFMNSPYFTMILIESSLFVNSDFNEN